MHIALALGLHPIVPTTLVAPRPPGDSTRESYPARLTTMSKRSWPAAA
jgi:hypothetical protein